ncbi:aspartate/glutamate racemase family protein [Variovorax sp. Sphag1AA]|uniref:aspartate/glutamate racemase family protein n=1 Tax=Variovorax sp. Sphag1AA TaxID=2587027 RepID=UPI001C860443|nr:aspartate/glutamate racemase family protein [Variovorax sp. Sphag1AA]
MRTLFLNPNSSDQITATLRRHISRCGWPVEQWDVAKVEGAPRIIGSATDNEQAAQALDRSLQSLCAGFDRVVMMSSVDTGYDIARRHLRDAAFGFTRSVLAQRARLGQKLQVITFDADMTALYEQAFEATGHAAVVSNWEVLDTTPSDVARNPNAALERVRGLCSELSFASEHPIFVVGAVGLDLAASLRQDGMERLIDPVSDLLAWLGDA